MGYATYIIFGIKWKEYHVMTRQQYDEVFAAGIRWGANNDGPYPHGCEFKG